jgi:hypothetical protein
MASASTNKTIWTLGIVGVLIFLAIKLWPAIRHAINSGSGGGGGVGPGGAAGGAQSPMYPQSNSPMSSLGSNLGLGSGGGAGAGQTSNPLSNFIGQLLDSYTNYENESPSQQAYVDSQYTDTVGNELATLDAAGLPLETTQNFDVNQLAQPIMGTYGSNGDEGVDTSYYDNSDMGSYLDDYSMGDYTVPDYGSYAAAGWGGYGLGGDYGGDAGDTEGL